MPIIPADRIGDRFVAIFTTITLVLFGIMAGLAIYLVIQVGAVQGDTHTSNIQQCQLANTTRLQDIAIWNQFLDDIAPPAKQTAAVKTELAKINHLIAVKDTPRDCAAAYPG
jgi:hypothetical protein